MKPSLNRRQFLATSALAAATAIVWPGFNARGTTFHGRIRKAKIIGKVTEAALQPLKDAGFEGVETTHVCPEQEAAEGRAVAEKLGMRVHSVLRGWMEFNSEDPKKVEASLESTRKALGRASCRER